MSVVAADELVELTESETFVACGDFAAYASDGRDALLGAVVLIVVVVVGSGDVDDVDVVVADNVVFALVVVFVVDFVVADVVDSVFVAVVDAVLVVVVVVVVAVVVVVVEAECTRCYQ